MAGEEEEAAVRAPLLCSALINHSLTAVWGTLMFDSAKTPPGYANRREPFPFRDFSPLLRAHLTKSCIAHRNVYSPLHAD